MATTTMVKTGCITVAFALFSIFCKAQLRANFTAIPVSGCAPLVVTFLDQSTGSPTQWKWDLGNGTISFLQNPSVTYFNPGQYTVKLVIQNASGRDSIIKSQYITIYAQPTVNFAASIQTGCFPLPVQYTDMSLPGSGTIDLWQWDFGDGTSSSLPNPSHTYTAAGNYNVSLRVRNSSGCFRTLTRTQYIQINSGVIANFSNTPPSSCTAPVNINFQNLSTGGGALSYLWNFGDGNTSTLANPPHSYTAPGSYNVTLIATNAFGCRDTLIKNDAITIGIVQAGFTAPSTACLNTTIAFINTSTPVPSSVLWRFGDGTTSINLNPSKSYSAPGTYQVKLISNFGACLDSSDRSITILPKPATAFSAPNTASCSAPHTVNFNNTTSNGTNYRWNFGDGNSSTLANPVHTYTTIGTYSVTLISTNSNGCSDTLVKTDYIKVQVPQVNINDSVGGCAPFSWTFIATINSVDPVTTYEWDFGDGTTSFEINPTHQFANGIYDIKLKITTASGCIVTVIDSSGITAGIKPVANFSATPRTVCARYKVDFTDLSTGSVDRWLWYFGDGGTSTEPNPTHIYIDTGYFSVNLVVWNLGCSDTITFTDYIYIDPPIASFTADLICGNNLTINFTDHSMGADVWEWNFGDGTTTSSLQNPSHTYADSGTYAVTLRVINNRTGCDFTTTNDIAIYGIAVGFSASDTAICKRSTVQFDAAGSNPNIISYQWNFGDGSSDTARSVSHAYNVSGVYDVSLVITDDRGCRDTLSKSQYIRVNGPVSNITASIPGSCSLSAITFTDNSSSDGIHPIIKWVWDYGDGIIDTLSAGPFQHTYSSPGTYIVKLIVIDNNNCSDTSSRTNIINISALNADFLSPDTVACPNRPIRFNNTSTGPGLTYTWYFGDGTTSTLKDPIHLYSADGSYSIKLVVRDQSGCTDSVYKSSFVQITTPIANFSVSDSVGTCPPLVVDFTNSSSSYTSINWDFGDGTSAQTLNPSHFYSTPGTYMAKLTAYGPGGCTSIKQQSIVIRGPQGSFSYGGLNGCAPFTVNFVASTRDRVSFIWDFDDGTTVVTNDSLLTHTYTIPGIYIPKMILRDAGGCVVPIWGIDTIKVIGINASFDFNSLVICNAATVQFSNTSSTNDVIASYYWDFGNGTTSNLENPSQLFNTTGIYYPKLRVTTLAGCVDSVVSQAPLKIVSSPQASLVQSADGCTPLAVIFNGSLTVPDTSAMTWQWNFDNGETSYLQNPPAAIYNSWGNYNVNLLVTNSSGCKDTVVTSVTAFATPIINAGLDTIICIGRSVALTASGAPSLVWSPSTGLSCSNCANPVATPSIPTSYIVTGSTPLGCRNSDTVLVNLRLPFNITGSPKDSLCMGNSISISATGAATYVWSPATGLNNTIIANPVASPRSTITYRVIGTDDRKCFSDTTYVPIIVFPIPTVEAGVDRTINVGQTIELLPTLSEDVTNVLWTPTGSIFRSNYPAATVKPRETTTYKVEVSNAGGCIATDNLTVYVLCNGTNFFIPNTFSPNGDGSNDVFYPRGTGLFSIKTARVFNRWGEVVYEKNDFRPNDVSQGWDGSYKGQRLNPDVYVYIIEILCDNNILLPLKGNIALIR